MAWFLEPPNNTIYQYRHTYNIIDLAPGFNGLGKLQLQDETRNI